MSRKSVNGQLNMFDYFRGLENSNNSGDVEMVSLVPDVELSDDKGILEKDIIMRKTKTDSNGRVIAEVAYLNYNKVRVYAEDSGTKLHNFKDSQEAVDFYVDQMLKLINS